jgi:hypothetical protein
MRFVFMPRLSQIQPYYEIRNRSEVRLRTVLVGRVNGSLGEWQ